jgi:hypothetical protein
MNTITDKYGRDIDVEIDVNGEDVYTLQGLTVKVPTGTPQSVALNSIEAMAPSDWISGTPEQPIEDTTPTIEELAEVTADQEQRIQALETQMATFEASLKQMSERLTPRVKGAK